jgi:hypothetical protein
VKICNPRLVFRIVLAVGVLAPVALFGVLSLAQERHGAGKKPPTAKEKFKNIQVLKDLPADQLIPTMHAFNNSLGVNCEFCHVRTADHGGWEKDDKPPKAMARKMILMVRDLNAHQKILDNKTTCFMCHHGHPEPEIHAPAPPTRPGVR